MRRSSSAQSLRSRGDGGSGGSRRHVGENVGENGGNNNVSDEPLVNSRHVCLKSQPMSFQQLQHSSTESSMTSSPRPSSPTISTIISAGSTISPPHTQMSNHYRRPRGESQEYIAKRKGLLKDYHRDYDQEDMYGFKLSDKRSGLTSSSSSKGSNSSKIWRLVHLPPSKHKWKAYAKKIDGDTSRIQRGSALKKLVRYVGIPANLKSVVRPTIV